MKTIKYTRVPVIVGLAFDLENCGKIISYEPISSDSDSGYAIIIQFVGDVSRPWTTRILISTHDIDEEFEVRDGMLSKSYTVGTYVDSCGDMKIVHARYLDITEEDS